MTLLHSGQDAHLSPPAQLCLSPRTTHPFRPSSSTVGEAKKPKQARFLPLNRRVYSPFCSSLLQRLCLTLNHGLGWDAAKTAQKGEQTALLHAAACAVSNLLLGAFIKLLFILTKTKTLTKHKKIAFWSHMKESLALHGKGQEIQEVMVPIVMLIEPYCTSCVFSGTC